MISHMWNLKRINSSQIWGTDWWLQKGKGWWGWEKWVKEIKSMDLEIMHEDSKKKKGEAMNYSCPWLTLFPFKFLLPKISVCSYN